MEGHRDRRGLRSGRHRSGRIFTSGHAEEAEHVFALDERTGKPLWSSSISGERPVKVDRPGSRVMPTVDGGLVYSVSVEGNLVCLDAATGKLRWEKHLVKEFRGTRPGWGYSESALVDDNLVLCTPGGAQGAVIAFNKLTGELAWRSKDFKDSAHYSALVPATIGGVKQYVQLTSKSIAGIAAADGQLLWRADRVANIPAVIPSPVVADGHVYVTSGYNFGCNGFSVTKDSAGFKAEELWNNKVLVNQIGGVVKIGDYIYGLSDSGKLVCQDFKSGEQKWAERSVGKGAVVFADGMLYCRSEGKDGAVALVEPMPDGYKERGRFVQLDRSQREAWAHPVVANGRLYLRDMDVLLCYDVRRK